ncbi:MAG: aminotransferase class I/II-fold pyridoxal phosphate-dependent enzyme [Sphaerochaetaceae bacterium]|nr:aminotransferase class I/II-fold pyridoxal phosphate-dependent enzyme [Sphaerochaetaceae bacterium]
MLFFGNDYSTGAHPKVLEALVKTNTELLTGYCDDVYCKKAEDKILKECNCPSGQVFLLSGGTQTNMLACDMLLSHNEGVIAATTGHINTHEAGAVEFTGHKILTIEHENGKITAKALSTYLENFYNDSNCVQMVFPGMVFLSFPTECGTVYNKSELRAIRQVCDQYDLNLYMDGARMGYGIGSEETDLALEDIASLCDAFYIGGTKVGALCGEALVFPKGNAPKHFHTIMKQHGALLAKGRLVGVQFDALFTNNLYIELGKNAVIMAKKLRKVLEDNGIKPMFESPTNQIFVLMEDKFLKKLEQSVVVRFWYRYDSTHSVVRLVTSWATTEEEIKAFEQVLCDCKP